MNILVLDPGKTTGFAYGRVLADINPELPVTGQLEFDRCSLFVEDFVANKEIDVIVCEDFTIMPSTAAKSKDEAYYSIELIGVCRHLSRKYKIDFELQKVSPAKKLANNDLLRRIGYYVKGDHARDSVRHFVLYLARNYKDQFEKLVK